MEKLQTFFKLLFGRSEGIICISTLNQATRKFQDNFFNYPQQLLDIVEFCDEAALKENVYFCPNLFSSKRRIKKNVIKTASVWADLDRCHPDKLKVVPSITLESSPGRFQGFWLLDGDVPPEEAEDISRRIAYFHKEDGADPSGWDLTQLLRVPFTVNFKYGELPVVEIYNITRSYYRVQDFHEYPLLPRLAETAKVPELVGTEDISGHTTLIAGKYTQQIMDLFSNEPTGEWSAPLWELELCLFEQGYDAAQVFVVARDSQCNKYARDSRPESELWKEVQRAEATYKQKNNQSLFIDDNEAIENEDFSIITRSEARYVSGLEPTFVEHYVEWAAELSDAAPQYHQAGAFIILSALISGATVLETSFGEIVPNLWFMILADTTLTRKSTAMDIATDLLEKIGTDSIMATDGSIEGMVSVLATRPKQPSIFVRDEFSGLIEGMLKKDYLAGMAETLTKLYDCKNSKRLLKKEVIEVRDPRFMIFAGGIKNRVTGMLTHEHVSSGFIPRFVFITAESDIQRVRSLGPPSFKNMEGKKRVLEDMRELFAHYGEKEIVRFKNSEVQTEVCKPKPAYLSEDAWNRFAKLEFDLLKLGLRSYDKELMTPVFDRLGKSILKAAILIAASQQLEEETVTVELDDLLRALKYGTDWKAYAEEVISSVGMSSEERDLDAIYQFIVDEGAKGGTSRSSLCRRFKLPARKATETFATLEARGMIKRLQTDNKGEIRYVAVLR